MADWGSGMSAGCIPRAKCSLARAMDGRIMRCRIISYSQSAATSAITTALLVTSLVTDLREAAVGYSK